MGQYNSKYVLEDFKSNKNESFLYGINYWNDFSPKNFDYYFNRPTTKISRKFYPEYERGLIYGYNNKVHYTNYIDEED
jgi:hypothetical protein